MFTLRLCFRFAFQSIPYSGNAEGIERLTLALIKGAKNEEALLQAGYRDTGYLGKTFEGYGIFGGKSYGILREEDPGYGSLGCNFMRQLFGGYGDFRPKISGIRDMQTPLMGPQPGLIVFFFLR